jgi:hypothetical protein
MRAISKMQYNKLYRLWGVYPSVAGIHEVRVVDHGYYILNCLTGGKGSQAGLCYQVVYISRATDMPREIAVHTDLAETRAAIRQHDAVQILRGAS